MRAVSFLRISVSCIVLALLPLARSNGAIQCKRTLAMVSQARRSSSAAGSTASTR